MTGALLLGHIDHYVMLSKHSHCDASVPVLLWLIISPADLAQPLSPPRTTGSTWRCIPWRCVRVMGASSVVQHGWPPLAAWVNRRVVCPSVSLFCALFFFLFKTKIAKTNGHLLLNFRLRSASNSKTSRLQT